jgi:hypothetical protein
MPDSTNRQVHTEDESIRILSKELKKIPKKISDELLHAMLLGVKLGEKINAPEEYEGICCEYAGKNGKKHFSWFINMDEDVVILSNGAGHRRAMQLKCLTKFEIVNKKSFYL